MAVKGEGGPGEEGSRKGGDHERSWKVRCRGVHGKPCPERGRFREAGAADGVLEKGGPGLPGPREGSGAKWFEARWSRTSHTEPHTQKMSHPRKQHRKPHSRKTKIHSK